jgi:hypothetical protein
MALKFLKGLGFVEEKSDLRSGQFLNAQQVAQAFRHCGSSQILAASANGAQRRPAIIPRVRRA